jgi:ketopantoate reductase
MKTLIVGAGALGGVVGARPLAAGASVSPATRNAKSAEELKTSSPLLGGLSNLTASMLGPGIAERKIR